MENNGKIPKRIEPDRCRKQRDNDIGYRKVRRNVRGSIADPVPVPVYPEVPGKRRYAWRNQRVTKAAGAA